MVEYDKVKKCIYDINLIFISKIVMNPMSGIGGLAILKKAQEDFLDYVEVKFLGKFRESHKTRSLVIDETAKIKAQEVILETQKSTIIKNAVWMELVRQEIAREMSNVQSVMNKAKEKIAMNAEWNIEIDKFKKIMDLSKEYSSDDMQNLIAWILAWEYNKSWSYSYYAISILRNLEKKDLEYFEKLWSLVIDWKFILGQFFREWNEATWWRDDEGFGYEEYLNIKMMWLIADENSVINTANNEGSLTKLSLLGEDIFLKSEGKKISDIIYLTKPWLEIMSLLKPKQSIKVNDWTKAQLTRQWHTLVIR